MNPIKNKLKKATCFTILSSCIALSACNKDKTPEINPGDNIPKKTFAPKELSAIQTVETFETALCNAELVKMWKMVPEDIQKDILKIYEDSSNQTDPEIYKAAMEITQSLSNILNNKKEMIFELLHDNAKSDQDKEKIEQFKVFYNPVVKLLDKAIKQQINYDNDPTTFDIEKSLEDIQPEIQEIVTLVLKHQKIDRDQYKSTFTILEELPEKVTIQSDNEHLGQDTFTLVKHNKKWIPNSMIDMFTKYKDQSETLIEKQKNMSEEEKAQTLMILTMAKGLLTSLENAKNKEEFNTIIHTQLGMFL